MAPVQGFTSDLTAQDFRGNKSSFMFLDFGSGIVVVSASRPEERDEFKGEISGFMSSELGNKVTTFFGGRPRGREEVRGRESFLLPLLLVEEFTLFFGGRPRDRDEGLQSCVLFPGASSLKDFSSVLAVEKGAAFSSFSTFPPSTMPDIGATSVIVQRLGYQFELQKSERDRASLNKKHNNLILSRVCIPDIRNLLLLKGESFQNGYERNQQSAWDYIDKIRSCRTYLS